MRRILALAAAVGLSMVGALKLWADAAPSGGEGGKQIFLLQEMEESRYPDAKMPQGATMSGGTYDGVYPTKCDAILTTPDPVEKVIAFYAKAFAIDAEGKGAEADGRRTSSQDDSKDRPVTVRVFTSHRADSTTIVVVSRGADEKETHIAWSKFLRLKAGG